MQDDCVAVALELPQPNILGQKELLHTLGDWREKILNYFDYRIANGFVERKNNRIKTIKSMAYGYRNMDNFRMRILITNPGGEDTVPHLLT